jgi:hypothetical protein
LPALYRYRDQFAARHFAEWIKALLL